MNQPKITCAFFRALVPLIAQVQSHEMQPVIYEGLQTSLTCTLYLRNCSILSTKLQLINNWHHFVWLAASLKLLVTHARATNAYYTAGPKFNTRILEQTNLVHNNIPSGRRNHQSLFLCDLFIVVL